MLEDHEPRQPGEIRAFVEYRNQPRPKLPRFFVGWDVGQSQDIRSNLQVRFKYLQCLINIR